jgi:beta-glucanase (GH16 family)
MARLLLFVLISCALSIAIAVRASAADGAQPPVKPDPKTAHPGWKLVWSDEFDTDGAPDPKKWGYETGYVRNGELQYYTDARSENARVEKGVLVIEGRKEKFANPKYEANAKGDWNKTKEFADYTSASLTTEKTASWTYGRVEVRAKIPTGRGTWPAIWMLGTNIHEAGWPKCGEIDILENVGFDPNGIHTTVHTDAYNHVKNTAKGHRTELKIPFDDFHVYAIEWTKKEITFLLDDQKVFAFENDGKGDVATWPYDKPQYLILNFAIGGGWGGVKGIDDSIFPQKFLIDYVRVYQKEEEKK